ncbi:DUF992 domain-containing protein [Hoeflea sp. CAU 1731]
MNPGKTVAAIALAITTAFSSAPVVSAADMTRGAPAPAPAYKERFVKIGVLSCLSDGSFGWIIGSHKDLQCRFEGQGSRELYAGSMTKVGADIGFTAKEKLVWAVYAPSHQVRPGTLSGTYVGLSANAELGLGLGANVLGGNFRDNINLVPLSVSGSVGLRVTAAIGALTLTQF